MGSTDLLFTFLAIPVFIAGIIKYGERTWALRSASTKQFRDSLLPDPDPGPDYAKVAEEFSQRGGISEVPEGLWFCYSQFIGSAKCLNEAGIFLRSVTLLSSISTLVAFSLVIDKNAYSNIDCLILFSDWAMLWLIKHKKPWTNSIYEAVSSSRRVLTNDDNRWSGSMAQFNLISFCLKDKPTKRDSVLKLFGIYEMLEKHQHRTFEDVNIELKDLIFQRIQENQGRLRRENVKEISTQRGDNVLVEKNCIDKFGWSIGIGQIRFRDTCAEAERFFQQRRLFKLSSRSNACMLLLQVNKQLSIQMVKGDRSKSVLFYGCKLAHLLQSLVTEEGWDNEEKWEMISYVWVEMLSYAASQCEWNHHAEQLRRGGELLTHVRLLKEHLGLSKQYQIFSATSRATVH
ncbi:hypothetical protein L1049_020594 [Liquidambar formosana]|uniref:DUF4220 domain-containing protein n=1 Tax=Liquidambar formosana TaxID=63359 RepID=A0AAP0SBK2_LIQFO